MFKKNNPEFCILSDEGDVQFDVEIMRAAVTATYIDYVPEAKARYFSGSWSSYD